MTVEEFRIWDFEFRNEEEKAAEFRIADFEMNDVSEENPKSRNLAIRNSWHRRRALG